MLDERKACSANRPTVSRTDGTGLTTFHRSCPALIRQRSTSIVDRPFYDGEERCTVGDSVGTFEMWAVLGEPLDTL